MTDVHHHIHLFFIEMGFPKPFHPAGSKLQSSKISVSQVPGITGMSHYAQLN
jgi:hypothetical protein